MIFINTKREGEYLHDRLNANGFPCRLISGDVEQKKRMRILEDFKEGKLPILIATDVASRGLHIDGVSHVVNYDLPQDCEDYVHRIGRTARAGEDGVLYLEAIEEYIKAKIPTEWAEDELFNNDYNRVARPKRKLDPKRGGKPEPLRKTTTGKPPLQQVKRVTATALATDTTEITTKKRRRKRHKPTAQAVISSE
jgi:ATP-dependent RNA helicase RhlB